MTLTYFKRSKCALQFLTNTETRHLAYITSELRYLGDEIVYFYFLPLGKFYQRGIVISLGSDLHTSIHVLSLRLRQHSHM